MLKRHADRMWGPSYVKHRFQKGMLERMEEWYIQRDNAWIFSKIDERHESRYKYTHTLSWILMNTHFFLKRNWVWAEIFSATICTKRIKVSGMGCNKCIMKLEYQQLNILICLPMNGYW